MKVALCAIAFVFAACASTDNFLRPPATVEVIDKQNDAFEGKVQLRCVRTGTKYVSGTPETGCLYQSVQVSFGPASVVTKEQRNALIDYLRLTADRNCANFVSRAFANRTGLDTTRNVVKDAATGAAAGTAKMLPGISAGLSFASIFGGNVVDNVNSSYYLRDTFPALKSAIESARTTALAQITAKKPADVSDYSLWEAILDMEHYGHLCSFDTAVRELTARASTPATAPAATQQRAAQTTTASHGAQP